MACVLPEHGCNLYFSVSAMKHAIKVFSSNHFLYQQQRSLKTLAPRPPGHFGDNALRMHSGIVRQVSGISLDVIWKDATSLWVSHTTAPPALLDPLWPQKLTVFPPWWSHHLSFPVDLALSTPNTHLWDPDSHLVSLLGHGKSSLTLHF